MFLAQDIMDALHTNIMRFYSAIHIKHWKQQKLRAGCGRGMGASREIEGAGVCSAIKMPAPKHIISTVALLLPYHHHHRHRHYHHHYHGQRVLPPLCPPFQIYSTISECRLLPFPTTSRPLVRPLFILSPYPPSPLPFSLYLFSPPMFFLFIISLLPGTGLVSNMPRHESGNRGSRNTRVKRVSLTVLGEKTRRFL